MPTIKQQALEMIKRLPEKATWDDIMYEIYVQKKITAGIKAADEGRVLPHEEVKRRFLNDSPWNGPIPAIANLENVKEYRHLITMP
jgi:hypothetical protein